MKLSKKAKKAVDDFQYIMFGMFCVEFPHTCGLVYMIKTLHIPRMEALFFWTLLMLGRKCKEIDIDNYDMEKHQDFFPCSSKLMMSTFGWDNNMQWKYFKSLSNRGYVDIKRVGIPPKRWIRTRTDKIRIDIHNILVKL